MDFSYLEMLFNSRSRGLENLGVVLSGMDGHAQFVVPFSQRWHQVAEGRGKTFTICSHDFIPSNPSRLAGEATRKLFDECAQVEERGKNFS